MGASHKTIKATSDNTLPDVLDAAMSEEVVLDKDGVRFRVTREDDIWRDYDPERARETIRAMAGSPGIEEGKRIKKLIYQGRDEGTRPADRPCATLSIWIGLSMVSLGCQARLQRSIG